ncbi:hypothetical protein [Parabacteroides johnsonii]|nr:hypothetical protein [Parabacteroides johnsonii]
MKENYKKLMAILLTLNVIVNVVEENYSAMLNALTALVILYGFVDTNK